MVGNDVVDIVLNLDSQSGVPVHQNDASLLCCFASVPKTPRRKSPFANLLGCTGNSYVKLPFVFLKVYHFFFVFPVFPVSLDELWLGEVMKSQSIASAQRHPKKLRFKSACPVVPFYETSTALPLHG